MPQCHEAPGISTNWKGVWRGSPHSCHWEGDVNLEKVHSDSQVAMQSSWGSKSISNVDE